MSKDSLKTKLTFHQVKFADIKEWDVTQNKKRNGSFKSSRTATFNTSSEEV